MKRFFAPSSRKAAFVPRLETLEDRLVPSVTFSENTATHLLKIDADSRPGREPSAHGVDEHVGEVKMGRGIWMPSTPPLEPGERVLFLRGAGDFDERML